jgi:hypothetical protein
MMPTVELIRNGSATDLAFNLNEESAVADYTTPTIVVSPAVGWFRSEDILRARFSLESKDPSEDTILIVAPTKFLLFRVVVHEGIELFRGCGVTALRMGQSGIEVSTFPDDTAKGHAKSDWIHPVRCADGTVVAEALFPYPSVGSVFSFWWEIEWKK